MEADEIIVDSFAGGGGASLGIAWALGRGPDIAINHDAEALAMHAANHPGTRHVLEDVWHANLRELVGDRPVGLLWASPDCKHFSRAKGATPVNKSIRSLAWVVVKWASQVRPRMIMLENVREFADWGPLAPQWACRCGWKGTEGQARLARTRRRCPRCDNRRIKITGDVIPDPAKKGLTFRLFCNRLRGFGYRVEWKTLNAADYGAPTHRRRLFLVARCDGAPIEWPTPTHGDPKKLDDSPLFERLKPWRTAAECIDWTLPCPSIFDRKKPLAEKTMRRIALGIKRYVLENAQPFIVSMAHTGTTGRGRYEDSIDEPLKTVTRSNDKAVVTPYIVPITHNGERRSHGPDEPLPTVTTANRGEHAVVAPFLSKYHHPKGDESRCNRLDEPARTLDTQPRFALCAAFLAKHFGGMVGVPIDTPLPTTTAIATQNQIVAANLVHLNHGDKTSSGVDEPQRTITATGKHAALVYSFLVKYFGTAIGANLVEPSPTVTTRDRFGLVTVSIAGELYVIADIGMRMLTPRELATAQGFPLTYLLQGTKTKQVASIGNSVSPYHAAAMVAANCGQTAEAIA
jgi:DNA (cytosine-5)-methyltransferase 1